MPLRGLEMANMSYARFQNTLKDLRDCYDNLDEELSESEEKDRAKLIKLCRLIADEYGDDNG